MYTVYTGIHTFITAFGIDSKTINVFPYLCFVQMECGVYCNFTNALQTKSICTQRERRK